MRSVPPTKGSPFSVDPEDESDNEEDLLVQFLFAEIKDLRVKVCRIPCLLV